MHILLGIENAQLRFSLEFLISQEPGVDVVGEASETEGLLALIKTSHPDLVLFEQHLSGRPFDSLLAEIRCHRPAPYLMVLSKNWKDEDAILAAGVDAFLVKGDPPEELLSAFRRIREQGQFSNSTTEEEGA
jgi:DNA-binding NarL/FixJ family response regulator